MASLTFYLPIPYFTESETRLKASHLSDRLVTPPAGLWNGQIYVLYNCIWYWLD